MIRLKDKAYYITKKGRVNLEKFCKDFFKKTGIKIMAEKDNDVVEGYLNSRFNGKKTYIEIILYDENKKPEFKEFIDNRKRKVIIGHKTRLKKPGLSKIKKIKIKEVNLLTLLKK